jgi:hypothetical protein
VAPEREKVTVGIVEFDMVDDQIGLADGVHAPLAMQLTS